jgi:hypothetical protein
MMAAWRSGLILLLMALYLTHSFVQLPHGNKVLGLVALLVIMTWLPYAKKLTRVLGSLMLLIGSIILVMNGSSLDVWIEAITQNVPIMTLIVLAPLLAIPLRIGRYDKSIESITNRYRSSPATLFASISGVFFLLTPTINLGSIKLIHAMFEKQKFPEEFLARVYVRGFTSVITWSPYFAAVLLVLFYFELSVKEYLPYAIVLGVVQLLLANILFLFEKNSIAFPKIEHKENKPSWKFLELFIVFTILTMTVLILEHFLPISMIVVVSLTVLIFPLFWSIYLRKLKGFIIGVALYKRRNLLAASNEVVLFLSAGFFGIVMSKTSIGFFLNEGVNYLLDISVLLMIFSTIVFTGLLALIGIHQIITVTSLASSVILSQMEMNHLIFALTLLSAWSVATIVSPITPVNVIVTNLLNRSFKEVAIRWNGLYALGVIMLHTLVIYSFYLLL